MNRTVVTRVLLLVALLAGLVGVPAVTASAATPNPKLGCGGNCILGATAVRGPFAVTMQVRTGVPARLTVTMTERYVNGKPLKMKHVRFAVTPTFETQHSVGIKDLQAGTVYDVEVQATDGEGRTNRRHGTLTTLRREVVFSIHRIDIVNDADALGPGEVDFYYFVGAEPFGTGNSRRVVNTGDRVRIDRHVRYLGIGPLNVLRVGGAECDAFGWYCRDSSDHSDRASAAFLIDVDHPGTRGTRTTPPPGIPAGHSGYVSFVTERGSYLQYVVHAYWDVRYVP